MNSSGGILNGTTRKPDRLLAIAVREILEFVSIHLWVLTTAVAGTGLIWYVPQISNLWQQRPYSGTESLGFGFLMLLLVWLYPVTLFWLWQRTLLQVWKPEWRDRLIAFSGRWLWLRLLLRLIFAPSRILTRGLQAIAAYSANLSKGIPGLLVITTMVVGGLSLSMTIPVVWHSPWLMFGGFVRMTGMWLMLVGIWLGFGKFFGASEMLRQTGGERSAEDDRDERRRRIWQVTGRVLSWVAAVSVLGEALWVAAAVPLPAASFRLYSVWAAIHIPVVIVVLAALVDFTQQHTRVQARLAVAFLLLCWIAFPWLLHSNTIQDPAPSTALSPRVAPASADWLDLFEQRIDALPPGPAVVVAASGGGSRAALFASLVLQHLAAQPMDWSAPPPVSADTSAGNEAAASGKSQSSPAVSTWADHIVLISSVSGGSLATARFAAKPQLAAERVSELQYSTKQELRLRTLARIKDWLQPGDADTGTADPDAAGSDEVGRLQQVQQQLSETAWETGGTAASLAFSSRMADDMAADFMAPILRGALIPFCSRGDSLYAFWEHLFEWHGRQQLPDAVLSGITSPATSAPANAAGDSTAAQSPGSTAASLTGPLVLFNTTDVETGRRVIVGFPSIPAGFLASAPGFPAEILDLTNMQTRGKEFGPVSLADFSPVDVTSLSLTRAVRLSSNFPWGFGVQPLNADSQPSVRILPDAPSVRGASQRTTIELVDGGVVDNTGIDSLAAFIETLFIRAETDAFGREAGILRKLRRRGVVFIEIDSGARPTGSAADRKAFGDVLRPLTALNNSSYTNAIRISDSLIQRLILRFAVSPAAARLSTLPLSTANPYFELDEDQLRGALPISIPADTDADRAIVSLFHFRFSCNHLQDTDADVMTAFALGPDDKATVIAMFLSEVQKWQWWQSKTHPAYTLAQQYFTPGAAENLPQELVSHLVFQLIDRTQGELQRLKLRSESPLKWSDLEQTQSLQRVVTLLLGLRSLSDIPSVNDQKSQMWIQLAKVTGYLQDEQLASVADTEQPGSAAPGAGESAGSKTAWAPGVIYRLNPEQLAAMLESTNLAKEQVQAATSHDRPPNLVPIDLSLPTAAGPDETDSSAEQTTPYLRDVLRQRSHAAKDAARQSRFFESKK